MTTQRPPNKSLLEELREALNLDPKVPDQEVLEQGRKFFGELQRNNQINEVQYNKFRVAWEKTMLVIAEVQKNDRIDQVSQHQWMRREHQEKRQAMIFVLNLAHVKAVNKAEEQERVYAEYDEIEEQEAEQYQVIEDPPVDTYPPSFINQYNVAAAIIADLKLERVFDVEAQVVQKDGRKTIMLGGITAENFDKVQEICRANGCELRPSFAGKKVEEEEEEASRFNPRPKPPGFIPDES